jgi:hypothetical protein
MKGLLWSAGSSAFIVWLLFSVSGFKGSRVLGIGFWVLGLRSGLGVFGVGVLGAWGVRTWGVPRLWGHRRPRPA